MATDSPARQPAVSVVLATYDRIGLLRAAVASVLAQTYRDFELLVVDDGSTDGTEDWLAGVDDPRVRCIRLAHTGSAARARNAGVAQAAGSFLAFLDSDDLWLPRKLEVQVEQTVRSGARWSYTRYEHIDAAGRRIPPRSGAWRELSGRIASSIITAEASVSIVTVLIDRGLFDELGGFDERPGIREDHELLVRVAVAADALAVSQCLAQVRDHPARGTRVLRGAEPFLVSARTCDVLLESLEDQALRRQARRRRACHLADARAARLKALLRRAVRPLLGREARVWRWLRWPRLRHYSFRDPIDCVIHALLASKRQVRFVQVGSNDGMTNDPLWTFRRYRNWSGVLVEPLDAAYRRLAQNYEPWADRFVLVPAAIATETGPRTFHHFAASRGLPAHLDQLGSLDAEYVRQHAQLFDGAETDSSEVQCLTFGDLLARHGPESPDLVHIDAEGTDEAILLQVPLTGGSPAIILYEHAHMGRAARAAMRARLEAAGYELLEIGADTLAVSGRALQTLPAVTAAWQASCIAVRDTRAGTG